MPECTLRGGQYLAELLWDTFRSMARVLAGFLASVVYSVRWFD